MKITNVEAFVLDTGTTYSNPADAGESEGVKYVSLLKISTDEGLVGWSDIETQPHVGRMVVEAPTPRLKGFEPLKHILVGEDPLQRERLWHKMYTFMGYYGRKGVGMHMLSGADNALWDIAGKAFNQPVHQLLGAKYRDKVKGYASTLFRPKPDDMKRAVQGYLTHGFQAIKFGWGVFGYDLALDVALVRAAREEAGPGVALMVDPGWYGVDPQRPSPSRPLKDWIRLVRELEALDVFWLEDFIHPENIAGYARVAASTTTLRIAAGEQASGIQEFRRLAEEGGVDVLQPDLSRCGGLTVGRKIADFAAERQLDCVPHAWLTDILKAASLHLNAYLPHSLYLEYNVSTAPLLTAICRNGAKMVDGHIAVPEGPGLGVDIDEDVIKRCRVA